MITVEPIHLTELAKCGGCAAKFGPGELHSILQSLPAITDPNVLVGIATGDDSAVYKVSKNLALVQTLDFFPPIVDDPYTYGAIAAANSLSDVYAMGGRPITAMNIVSFPADKPKEILKEILHGGAAKATEAGVPIVGGHTIDDAEPKFGMSVTGLVRPGKQWTNANARPGDVLILTKAIGTGIITTSVKNHKGTLESIEAAIKSMLVLNKAACDAGLEVGIRACTDVTGFSLMGHLLGMMKASKTSATIYLDKLPLLPGALELGVEREISPGGTGRNQSYCEPSVTWKPNADIRWWRIVYDPQTSGGLLFSVPLRKAARLVDALQKHGVEIAAQIGEVTRGTPGTIVIEPTQLGKRQRQESTFALSLTRQQADEIIAHAKAERPNECCGILVGKGKSVTKVHPANNIDKSPVKYTVDPKDIIRVMKEADQENLDILAFYHSHTFSEAYPSPTDVKAAASGLFEYLYMIVSLADSEEPVLRLFRIIDNRDVQEVKLRITK